MTTGWEWPDVDVDVTEASAGAVAVAQPGDAPALYFTDLAAFVREQLAPMYRRSLSATSMTWCPKWWLHAEAIERLEALWRAWEHLRLDPATGISVWFRDHCDHHMSVLLSADGPFKGCSPEKGHTDRLEALPLAEPPEQLFVPARRV